MKNLILYICFSILSIGMVRADLVKDDSSTVEIRTFDETKIHEFQKNPRYDYETKESWLKKLWNKFWELIGKILGKNVEKAAKSSGGSDILNAIIAVAAVILLIFGLSKVKFRTWIAGKGAVVEQQYEVEEENIHEIEFDKDIRDAEKDGDYRRAIRLHFLKMLKNLSDAELIYWDPNKTNHQYLYELKGTNIYSPFVNCVNIFDRVWYGEWKIDQSFYIANKSTFEELANTSVKIKTAVFNG